MIKNYSGFKARVKSFQYAFSGIRTMLVEEPNAWVHAVMTVAVAAAGFYFNLSMTEWCWIVLAIVSVWTAEALNTAFESLADVASPNFHPMVEKAKNVAAGAVLITSIGAAIVGVLVFGPYLF
ncbi:MAG: diacylglycerol kinase family protein [Elusimicrobia bacterium]|nr:diacylglycerol kinase family protein [Elusimicrobiota bacterium]